MPSKYDPARALPLQVSPDLRAELDALVAAAPAALRFNRNMVAVEALRRGLAVLRAELARDPLAIHRGLVGETPAPAETVAASSSAPSAPTAATRTTRPSTTRPSTSSSTRASRAAAVSSPEHLAASAAIRARLLASGTPVATFAKAHKLPRSTVQAWAAGSRVILPDTLARVDAALRSIGR